MSELRTADGQSLVLSATQAQRDHWKEQSDVKDKIIDRLHKKIDAYEALARQVRDGLKAMGVIGND